MAGVIWSNEARQDLDSIFLRLSTESKLYSEKWINEVFSKIELIEKFPNIGRRVPEVKINSVREFFVGSYRIIYNISKAEIIEILAVRHSSRPLSEF
jgi:toxin ParE1/3/4